MKGLKIVHEAKKQRIEYCDAATMNAKTNVSILQEMMVKKGTVPNYDLIHDGGGTHINTFTYRVTCDGFMATGTGRCKKDAKHIAAKNMLETIAAARSYPQLPATPADSPVRTPLPEQLPPSPKISPNEPFLNAIGDLKDLCAENELAEPEYNMISDVGPPHARIFTYQCVVSTFKEEGRAMTKKQAKHEASRKMLERLIEVVSDLTEKDSIYACLKIRSNDAGMTSDSADYAKSLYGEVTKLPMKKINLGVKLVDYHLKLKKSFNDDTIPTRNEVLNNLRDLVDYVNENNLECSRELLDSIKLRLTEFLTTINLELSSVTYECSNSNNVMLLVKVNSIPDIVEIEIGDNIEAMELKAISKVLKTFELFVV